MAPTMMCKTVLTSLAVQGATGGGLGLEAVLEAVEAVEGIRGKGMSRQQAKDGSLHSGAAGFMDCFTKCRTVL